MSYFGQAILFLMLFDGEVITKITGIHSNQILSPLP